LAKGWQGPKVNEALATTAIFAVRSTRAGAIVICRTAVDAENGPMVTDQRRQLAGGGELEGEECIADTEAAGEGVSRLGAS
jgi:hypothetical protein